MRGAYEGTRIIDFTQMEQGPVGTQVLADFGAEVIKVERIDVGDIGCGNMPQVNGVSTFFASCNRNKKSLSVDVKTPEGRDGPPAAGGTFVAECMGGMLFRDRRGRQSPPQTGRHACRVMNTCIA
jgi:hypothetical protein